METRSDAHGLRRLSVVLVVECPRLAHDRVSRDSNRDVLYPSISWDRGDTFKIIGVAWAAHPINRSSSREPYPVRNRCHRTTAAKRCRAIFDRPTQNLRPALHLKSRVIQQMEGS